MYKKIDKCRICSNTNLVCVLDLGVQSLTGVFPKTENAAIISGPLRLVKCHGESVCGLLQLEHSYDLGEMYGENYGYRSGLNASMVRHLQDKVHRIIMYTVFGRETNLPKVVLDIGSNDGTTLRAWGDGLELIGFDPTGEKFREYYPTRAKLIPDFFSAALFKEHFPDTTADIVTSFSMFYDLEDPTQFMREVYEILHHDGIWVFEQSYMPAMLETNGYDTVCHEHLEFYALKQIKWMADRVGFVIRDVEFNQVNGGSFSVTLAKWGQETTLVAEILEEERALGLDTLKPFLEFAEHAAKSKQDLLEFIQKAKSEGKLVMALGASTKGNVLLQYCGFSDEDITYIGEVNEDKFDSYTPGSWIPIIPEAEMLGMEPDYVIVLPWHFRKFFLFNPKYAKLRLVFPLPELSFGGTNEN